MVLPQQEIRQYVERGELVFDPPIEDSQWGPTSVDLRLGLDFTKIRKVQGVTISVAHGLQSVGSTGLWDTDTLKERDKFGKRPTFTLSPTEFVLSRTYESVRIPYDLIGLIEGRSTYARVGLSMHQTAPWIHPGFRGRITLEMRNSGPLDIALTPLIDKPCQLTFFRLTSAVEAAVAYGARPTDIYQDQQHPLKPHPND